MPVDIADLESTIRNAFSVAHLEIEDQSSGCGESYAVLIVSEDFKGKTTLARHRLVNEALKTHISEMHAFSQKAYTPEQYNELSKKST